MTEISLTTAKKLLTDQYLYEVNKLGEHLLECRSKDKFKKGHEEAEEYLEQCIATHPWTSDEEFSAIILASSPNRDQWLKNAEPELMHSVPKPVCEMAFQAMCVDVVQYLDLHMWRLYPKEDKELA